VRINVALQRCILVDKAAILFLCSVAHHYVLSENPT
jgi:hypothetical protein